MANETDIVVRLKANSERLQRDLNRAKQRMAKFETQTARMTKAIQANFASMFAGAGVAQAGRYAISTLADFEFQMSKVQAITGKTKDEMQPLIRNAQELGAVSKFTATEIGKLQEEFSRLGFAAEDIINLTDATRQLATVADAELGESAKVVGNVINAFGLETMEAGRIANTMAESFSKSALDLEKFSVAMGNVGANAKAFGLTVEETTAYLGALVDAGIDASKAGTDLRTILIESNKSGLTLNEAFAKVRNSTDQLGTATELFGKRAGAAGIILAENTVKVDELTKAFSDNKREMLAMTEVMEDNLLTDLAKLKSALDGAILQGDGLGGVFRRLTQDATALVNVFNDFDPGKWLMFAASGFSVEVAKSVNQIQEAKKAIDELKAAATTGPTQIPGIVIPQDRPATANQKTEGPAQMSLAPIAESMGLPFLGMTDDQYDAILSSQENKIKGFHDLHDKWKHETNMFDEMLQDGASAIATGFASLATSFFQGGDNIGKAITQSFGRMMSQIGFKYIEAGALFFANSLLAQAGTGGFPNPLSIHNQQMAIKSIGIGTALGATGGILSRVSSGIGNGGGGFTGDSGRVGRGGQSVTLNGQFRIQGSDLVYVLDRERNITGRTG